MKYTLKRTLALLIAMLLAMPTFAFAEEPVGGTIVLEGALADGMEVAVPDLDTEVTETEDVPLELSGLDMDLSQGELIQGDGGEPKQNSVATWCFIVDGTLFATQEARDGDLIFAPDDPAAPEGKAFAGWELEDGTRLFVDGDGDGAVDPVIAHTDPLYIEVNVFARFLD